MRKLDIQVEKRGDRFHWYAIDIDSQKATNEGCCSVTRMGGKCNGFEDEKSAKIDGEAWNKFHRS